MFLYQNMNLKKNKTGFPQQLTHEVGDCAKPKDGVAMC